jgi:hypothetical protein
MSDPVIAADGNVFVQKHQADVTGVLSSFDRMLFKGYLPLRTPEAMEGWLAGTSRERLPHHSLFSLIGKRLPS